MEEAMQRIDELAATYRDCRELLAARVMEIEERRSRILEELMPEVFDAIRDCSEAEAQLLSEIKDNSHLFKRPKTRVLRGIKVGFEKKQDNLKWDQDSEEKIVKALKRLFPDQVGTYLKVTEKPIKTAIKKLSIGSLRRLGVTVVEGKNEAVCKPVDSELDKVVKALLDSSEKE